MKLAGLTVVNMLIRLFEETRAALLMQLFYIRFGCSFLRTIENILMY